MKTDFSKQFNTIITSSENRQPSKVKDALFSIVSAKARELLIKSQPHIVKHFVEKK